MTPSATPLSGASVAHTWRTPTPPASVDNHVALVASPAGGEVAFDFFSLEFETLLDGSVCTVCNPCPSEGPTSVNIAVPELFGQIGYWQRDLNPFTPFCDEATTNQIHPKLLRSVVSDYDRENGYRVMAISEPPGFKRGDGRLVSIWLDGRSHEARFNGRIWAAHPPGYPTSENTLEIELYRGATLLGIKQLPPTWFDPAVGIRGLWASLRGDRFCAGVGTLSGGQDGQTYFPALIKADTTSTHNGHLIEVEQDAAVPIISLTDVSVQRCWQCSGALFCDSTTERDIQNHGDMQVVVPAFTHPADPPARRRCCRCYCNSRCLRLTSRSAYGRSVTVGASIAATSSELY